MNTDKNNTQLPQLSVSVSAFLNGKAKQDFEKWLDIQEVAPYKVMFWDIPKIVQVAYIVEWLDSVDFYLDIEIVKDRMLGYVRGFDSSVIFTLHVDLMTNNSDCLKDDIYDTRAEAVLKAIQKANEVYNVKFFQAEH